MLYELYNQYYSCEISVENIKSAFPIWCDPCGSNESHLTHLLLERSYWLQRTSSQHYVFSILAP